METRYSINAKSLTTRTTIKIRTIMDTIYTLFRQNFICQLYPILYGNMEARKQR